MSFQMGASLHNYLLYLSMLGKYLSEWFLARVALFMEQSRIQYFCNRWEETRSSFILSDEQIAVMWIERLNTDKSKWEGGGGGLRRICDELKLLSV